MELPVYLITGFLESGKTSFILDTIGDKQFTRGQKTLIIACEEGEVEYNPDILKAAKAEVEYIENEEDFTLEKLSALEKKHKPTQIMMEYNGMWSLRNMPQNAPKHWIFYQIFMFIDHTKYQIYMNNMRQLLSDNFAVADVAVFNRCEKNSVDKKQLRRSIKALNPRIDMLFEYTDGTVEQGFQGEDEMPYDLNANPIEIVHDDFGLWYVDILSSPQRYIGKNIHVRGTVFRASNVQKGYFVISRKAMTCCADDIQMVGILVKSPEEGRYKNGEWVEVTGKIITERQAAYKGEGPVIAAGEIRPTQPAATELVYFN